MKSNEWTGGATRLVTVDVNVYNPNIELFCVSRLGIEFLPSGRVYPSTVMMPAVLTRYEKAGGILWATLEFILYGYVVVLTGRMLIEMCSLGLSEFFSGPLNCVEFLNQMTFMLVFCLRISQEAMIAPKYNALGHSGGEAVDLFAVAYIERTIDNVMAFNAVLMYMRLLKFLSINPNVGKIVHIFTVAIRALLYLLLIVFILLFAYALAFHLLFRTSYSEFATMGAALMTVIRSVLGDFPIIELEGTNAVLARILFISYMVVLFFIVLNMFIAVLSEVAHVYSLQPSLDEYREWFKMKMLLKEMFCCCFGYGQDGNSVIDDDDDDEADLQAEADALEAYGRDRESSIADRFKEAAEERRAVAERADEHDEGLSEAAKLNKRMASVEEALSSIGDLIMEKQARKASKKDRGAHDPSPQRSYGDDYAAERPRRPASRNAGGGSGVGSPARSGGGRGQQRNNLNLKAITEDALTH